MEKNIDKDGLMETLKKCVNLCFNYTKGALYENEKESRLFWILFGSFFFLCLVLPTFIAITIKIFVLFFFAFKHIPLSEGIEDFIEDNYPSLDEAIGEMYNAVTIGLISIAFLASSKIMIGFIGSFLSIVLIGFFTLMYLRRRNIQENYQEEKIEDFEEVKEK